MLRKDLKIDICGPEQRSPGGGEDLGTSITNVGCQQVDPGSASFLFIPDLTDKATGGVLVVLLVLYVGSQLLSSVLMSVTADRNQRMIMLALPFVFVPFIQSFPAGLHRLLDHDEPVDGRPAVPHPPNRRPARARRPRRGDDRRSGGLLSGRTKDEAKDDGKAGVEPARRPSERRGEARAPRGRTVPTARPARRAASAPPPPPRRRKKKTGRRR